jgi:hypothetical protein
MRDFGSYTSGSFACLIVQPPPLSAVALQLYATLILILPHPTTTPSITTTLPQRGFKQPG